MRQLAIARRFKMLGVELNMEETKAGGADDIVHGTEVMDAANIATDIQSNYLDDEVASSERHESCEVMDWTERSGTNEKVGKVKNDGNSMLINETDRKRHHFWGQVFEQRHK